MEGKIALAHHLKLLLVTREFVQVMNKLLISLSFIKILYCYVIDQVTDTFILFCIFSVVNAICKIGKCCPRATPWCVGGGECCEGLECKMNRVFGSLSNRSYRCRIKGNRRYPFQKKMDHELVIGRRISHH